MKEINLSQGKIALVDDEDYDYLNQWKWCAHKERNGNYYALRTTQIPKKTIYMHVFLLDRPKNMQVDHKDRNGLNNQRHNLRICTHGQNQMNRRASGISKYLGVSVDGGKFSAQIRVNNKSKTIGRYKTEIEAAEAYNNAAVIYHGEFANLNDL